MILTLAISRSVILLCSLQRRLITYINIGRAYYSNIFEASWISATPATTAVAPLFDTTIPVVLYWPNRGLSSFYLIPVGLFCSTVLFYTSFTLLARSPDGKQLSEAKFGICGVGLLFELVAHLIAHPPSNSRSRGSIVPRLGALVVIILGEVSNTNCQVLLC